ncbi:MAG: 30S ribosomal protein S3 [Candidatus Marsarchaeota archaeon]|nr:30S ribosomal protein S3 [Candidatus Marsarchaeota archaeon]
MVVERKFIEDAMVKHEITKYLEKTLSRAGFSRVEIQKTPVITRITAYVTNPGRVIGRGGSTIDAITQDIKSKFKIDNPQISVAEVKNELLEPRLVARHIANALERGANARSLLHSALRTVMENGALGAEIIATGKLAAKGAKAKQIKVRFGYIPKAGDSVKLVDKARVTSYPKYGAIGIQVMIVQPGTSFPDRQIAKMALPKSLEGSK